MTNSQKFEAFADTDEVQQDLKGRSVRAFSYLLSSSGGLFILRLVSTAVLARILTPDDFGLVMMVTAVTAIADNFRDLGLSTATIQREQISRNEVTNLFWINALAGLTLCLLIAGAAPLIARFYEEPRLLPVTLALSTVFLFGGLTVQHQALLTRQLKHGRKSLVQLGAFLISSILAIGLGLAGFGFWALVLREVAQSILVLIGIWLICPWKPGWPDLKSRVGNLVRFGSGMTLSQLIGSISSSLDRFLIGRFFGAGLVAMYRQPYQLVVTPISQFMGPLYQVALPGLSMLQGDSLKYIRFYTRIATVVAMVSMPLSLLLAIYAPEITLLVLGNKWESAAIYFRIFSIGAFFRAVSSITGFVLVSRGNSRTLVKLGMVNSLVMALLMGLSLPWGPVGIAVAEVATVFLMFYPRMHYSFCQSPVTVLAFLSSIARPACASVGMAVGLLLSRAALVPHISETASLAAGLAFAPAAFVGILRMLPGGRGELKSLIGDLQSVFARVSPANTSASIPTV